MERTDHSILSVELLNADVVVCVRKTPASVGWDKPDLLYYFRPGELHPILVSPARSAPTQMTSGASPDVDSDGVNDVGMVEPGIYLLEPGYTMSSAPAWKLLRWSDRVNRVPVIRKTDHSTKEFTEAERSASRSATGGLQTDEYGHYARDVLLHIDSASIACLLVGKPFIEGLKRLSSGREMLLYLRNDDDES